MISEGLFKDWWALLCERFRREPSSILLIAYYQSLSPRMNDDEFKSAASRIFDENEFFPKPADFWAGDVLAAKAEALDQWEQVQAMMQGSPATLSAEAKRVIRLLGGETRLRQSGFPEHPFIRKDFLELYGDAVAISRREERPLFAPSPEAKKVAAAVQVKSIDPEKPRKNLNP